MQNRLAAITFFLIIFYPFHTYGQKLVNSPYARFNLGLLEPSGSFRSAGMGGISIALSDNSSVFFLNPASYAGIDTNSFIFDFGIDYSINVLKDGDSRYTSDDMNFDHLMMGFPVTKRLGAAAGILPFSNGYYNIAESVLKGDPGYDPVTGEYRSYHSGEGGLNSLFVGAGINITKNLSAGINMTVLFGQINRANQYVFGDYYNVFHDRNSERIQLNGLNFDYGVQYTATIKKDYFINAGASFTAAKNYKSNYENLTLRYTAYTAQDTLTYVEDHANSTLPGTLRFGIAFGKKNKFVTGIDYITSQWSESKIRGSEGFITDSRSIRFGAELIPDKFSNYSLLQRIEYRMGGHFDNSYLVINGEQIKEIGFGIGIGLPMPRSLSKTNIFIDYTRKSGPGENMHTENYFTFGVSLNLYDFWFIKQKYD
ncbi:MAG: hypothetical protein IQL11_02150 [Bacteroidales bacterium]|nr:hypothetical protein [Bacteroidales bacterium]